MRIKNDRWKLRGQRLEDKCVSQATFERFPGGVGASSDTCSTTYWRFASVSEVMWGETKCASGARFSFRFQIQKRRLLALLLKQSSLLSPQPITFCLFIVCQFSRPYLDCFSSRGKFQFRNRLSLAHIFFLQKRKKFGSISHSIGFLSPRAISGQLLLVTQIYQSDRKFFFQVRPQQYRVIEFKAKVLYLYLCNFIFERETSLSDIFLLLKLFFFV